MRPILAVTCLALLPIAAASAQAGDLAPTDGGGGWQVSCAVLSADSPPSAGCNSVFANAVRVTASPAGWSAVPVTGSAGDAYYISPTASGSLWAGSPNENPHYEYTFRTQFWQGAASPAGALSLGVFWLDNYWGGWSLNGNAFNLSGITPTPAAPNGGNWTTQFGLNTGTVAFVSGWNTLDLRITGNGRTDGILAQGSFDVASSPQETVPEPATMTLLASGLVGLAAARRRKR